MTDNVNNIKSFANDYNESFLVYRKFVYDTLLKKLKGEKTENTTLSKIIDNFLDKGLEVDKETPVLQLEKVMKMIFSFANGKSIDKILDYQNENKNSFENDDEF